MCVVCADVWITTSGENDYTVPYYFSNAVHNYVQKNANSDNAPILIGVNDASGWFDKIIEKCHDVSTVAQQVRYRLFLPVYQ